MLTDYKVLAQPPIVVAFQPVLGLGIIENIEGHLSRNHLSLGPILGSVGGQDLLKMVPEVSLEILFKFGQ